MTYFRTRAQGEPKTVNGTTGAGTAVKMPNYGVSVITNTSGEVFVLDPPVMGCRKTIVYSNISTANLCVVRASTSGGGISFIGATTGQNLITMTTARHTVVPVVIELLGLNTTSWVISNVFPQTSLFTAVTVTSG
jgi:hypothetical protein